MADETWRTMRHDGDGPVSGMLASLKSFFSSEDGPSPIDGFITFIQSNPLLLLALCFMIYKQWQGKQPWCASSPRSRRMLPAA